MHPGVPHGVLLGLYQAALTAVDGARCVADALTIRPLTGRMWAVALGKAASAMLAGAFNSLGERLERALLITKHGHLQGREFPRTEVVLAAHPLPDDSSLAAGRRLLDFMAAAPADITWLLLISGGASSLVEVLPEGVSLTDVQRANQWLLASGFPIEEMNAIRRRLSRIKGGRLCEYLGRRPARVLLISDVPGDDPAVIASGLLHVTVSPVPLPAQLPTWLRVLVIRDDALFAGRPSGQIDTEVVARLDQALDAAASAATAHGFRVYRSHERLRGDAQQVGQQIAVALCAGAPGVYLWGGETTVCLPQHPGQGGRCQQLALAAAQVLAGQRDIYLLAAGTDGNDGPGVVAGACVDGQTLERGSLEGLDAASALQRADAGHFLEAAGDLLDTGPTGTNVTDVVMGLKLADVQSVT